MHKSLLIVSSYGFKARRAAQYSRQHNAAPMHVTGRSPTERLTAESSESIKTGAYLLAVELQVPPGRPDHIHCLLDSRAVYV